MSPGVDVERFRATGTLARQSGSASGWDDGVRSLAFSDEFVPRKACPPMCAPWARRSAWRALFVGGGPMADDLAAFSAANPRRVKVLTGVVHDEVGASEHDGRVVRAQRNQSRWREQFGAADRSHGVRRAGDCRPGGGSRARRRRCARRRSATQSSGPPPSATARESREARTVAASSRAVRTLRAARRRTGTPDLFRGLL